jgi:hypothetical protein
MSHIFISYCHKDKDKLEALLKLLYGELKQRQHD